MRFLTLAAALCATLAPAVPAAAQHADTSGVPALGDTLPIDPQVIAGRLANGVRYLIRVNHRPEDRAELRLVVNAGSVLETDAQRGIAHFVEHMAFNGTRHFPKQDLVAALERMGMRFGADLNAYTDFDETVYMLTVPTDTAQLVSEAFQILEDWADGLTFDPKEVDLERGVILEEWRLGRGAQQRMLDRQLPILFRGSRYAERLPIGDTTVIETASAAALRRFYHDWYRPDLLSVIAVGDFDPTTIEALIRRHFAGLTEPASPPERVTYPVPDHAATYYAIATDPEATQTQVSLYFTQPVRQHATYEAYRQSLVESLFNQMLNERLFEITQQPDAPFVGAYSGQGSFVRSKEVYALGAAVHDGGVARGLRALLVEAARVDRYGFTATELERAKREMLRSYEQSFAERDKTNSTTYAAEYTRHVLEGEAIPGIATEYQLVQRFLPGIDLDEVNALAREWITDRNRVVLVSAPEKADQPVPDSTALAAVLAAADTASVTPYADVVRNAPLVPTPPAGSPVVEEREIDTVGVRVWRLGNGVRVILKPTDFKDDEVVFQGWGPGGTSLAPDSDYVPAITATSAVSVSGVGDFSLVELQKALAGKAVSVSPYLSTLYEGLSGQGSPKDLETLFQLIYLYVTAPRADSAAFEAYRARVATALANRSASPEAAFSDTLSQTLTQYSPRRRPPTPALVDEMNLSRSLAFYRDRFADAGDFTFVFVGSFDPDSIRPLVETYLGGLPASAHHDTWRDEGIRPPAGVVNKTVRKGLEPKSETAIVFTGPFDDTREQRYALRSLQDVLEIRLRDRLREALGATYSVGVSASSDRLPRPEYSFQISFGSAPERAEELVSTVFQEIDSIAHVGPTTDEIDKVRETQRRERETSLRQNGYWLGQLVGYTRAGLDFADIPTYERLIDALGPATVRDAAATYLRPDRYVRVTLLPAAGN